MFLLPYVFPLLEGYGFLGHRSLKETGDTIRRILAGHSHGALVQALPVSIGTEMANENSRAALRMQLRERCSVPCATSAGRGPRARGECVCTLLHGRLQLNCRAAVVQKRLREDPLRKEQQESFHCRAD